MGSTSSPKQFTMLVPTAFSKSDGRKRPCAGGCFTVENPPYKIDTLVFIGTPKAMRSYLKTHLGVVLDTESIDFDSASGMTLPMSRRDGSTFVTIWLPSFDFSPTDVSVLVHEVIHATIYILKLTGVKAKIFDTSEDEDADDEVIANAADTMFENILDRMAKRAIAKMR